MPQSLEKHCVCGVVCSEESLFSVQWEERGQWTPFYENSSPLSQRISGYCEGSDSDQWYSLYSCARSYARLALCHIPLRGSGMRRPVSLSPHFHSGIAGAALCPHDPAHSLEGGRQQQHLTALSSSAARLPQAPCLCTSEEACERLLMSHPHGKC